MAEKKEKVKATGIEEVMKELEKSYGKGVVMKFSDKTSDIYDVISTGSIAFDNALGIGGFALGRQYELKGWEGAGKTTICGHLAAGAQQKYPSKKVLYIDGEHALDVKYFKQLGVNVDEMLIAQPTFGEEGFEIAKKMIETGTISLCIIDSDTQLKPRSEVQGEIGDNAIGKKARLNSQAYSILHTVIANNNCCLVVISQFREKIGVMFGSPETTSGGNALRFYSDVIMEVRKSLLKEDDEAYGNRTKIKITKNKMAVPYKTAEFNVRFGVGIDKEQELLDMGIELDIFKKWGSTITLLNNGAGGETKYTLDEFAEAAKDINFQFHIRNEIMEKLNKSIDGKQNDTPDSSK